MNRTLDDINQSALKKDIPHFGPGDIINVHFRIVEGDKERTQMFQGIVISRTGSGINEYATIRKIVDEIGVERIFPVHSPLVAQYEMVRRSDARRAKLYYLRDRSGKSRRLRDRRRGMKQDPMAGVAPTPAYEPLVQPAAGKGADKKGKK
jgi:large subunit ribosomal protein L19